MTVEEPKPGPPGPDGNCCADGDWCQRVIHSTAEALPIVTAVLEAMTAAGFRDKDLFDVRLALEEAIVNAVKHGNRNDPAKQVRVRYRVTAEEVEAEVEDQGPGFDPGGLPDPTALENLERPCGRGVFLIRCYTSWMRYNERGNCLTLGKRRSPAPPGAPRLV
jgi:serine/threonine-protein kinase RsbW